MACKNALQIKRCISCYHLNTVNYGTPVCYELILDRDGKKAAKTVSPNQVACNKFREVRRMNVAN